MSASDRRPAGPLGPAGLSSSLDPLFAPRAVAVVGASRRRGRIGSELLHNLRATGFTGTLVAINPHASEIDGVPAYPSLATVPHRIDLAVLTVPAADVAAEVDACIDAGVRAIVVISAGFRETGPVGAALEAALVERVRAAGVRLVGPNCMGVINTDPDVRLNATFAPVFPPAGPVAFLTQSGALGLAILQHASRLGIGISTFVSVGNAADVSTNDLIRYWADDPATSAILLYLESVGNPRTFTRLVRSLTPHKPVVLVKAGRSTAGARAAQSHTGALATGDVVIDAMCRQTGVVRVPSIEELFGVAAVLAHQPIPAGPRVAILTNSGGPGIMAADAVDAVGLVMASLSETTTAALRTLCPAEASVRNPVDLLAAAPPDRYAAAMRLLLDDPNVDSVLAVYTPPLVTASADVARAIRTAVDASPTGKPVLATFLDAEGVSTALGAIPTFAFPEAAVAALAHVTAYGAWRRHRRELPVVPSGCDLTAAAAPLRAALAAGRGWLTTAEVETVLTAIGARLVSTQPVTRETLAATAEALGYPVALKAAGPEVIHKTELGAVALDVRTAAELLQAYDDMAARLGPRMQGAVLQPFMTGGVEMIIGAASDPAFGPLVTCGLGGTRVELLRDVATRLAPVTPDDVEELLSELKGGRLLDGYRGAPAADRGALVDAVCRVAWLVAACPEVAELDLNPALATSTGVLVLDARIRVAPPEQGRRTR